MLVVSKIRSIFLKTTLFCLIITILQACDGDSGCGPRPYYILDAKSKTLIQYKPGQQLLFLHKDSTTKPADTVKLIVTDTVILFKYHEGENYYNCQDFFMQTKAANFRPLGKYLPETGIYAENAGPATFYLNFNGWFFEHKVSDISEDPNTAKVLDNEYRDPNYYSPTVKINVTYSIAKGIIQILVIKNKETWTLIQ